MGQVVISVHVGWGGVRWGGAMSGSGDVAGSYFWPCWQGRGRWGGQ
jgi:hypothetical protein